MITSNILVLSLKQLTNIYHSRI